MSALAAPVARAAVQLLGSTLRLSVVGSAHLDTLRRTGRPILFSVWHGRILVPILHHRQEGIVAMVSRSKDGDVAAAVLHGLGYDTVRGSSSKGGGEALEQLVERVGNGRNAAIIPDGPRGPARRFKSGTLYLAQKTNAAILPLSFSARPARLLRSWDRFLLPLPFARAVLVYGTPIDVPADASPADIARVRQLLEAELSALEAEADRIVGLATASANPRREPPGKELR